MTILQVRESELGFDHPKGALSIWCQSGGEECDGVAQMRRRVQVEDKRTQARRKRPENVTEQLRALREVSIALAGMRDLKEILKKITDAALSTLETDVVVVFLVDQAKHTLVGGAGSTSLGAGGLRRLEEACGTTLTELEFPLERGKALIVDTILDGRPRLGLTPLRLKEMTRYEAVIPLLDTAEAAFGEITVSMVPLIARQEPFGVMIFLSPEQIHPLDKELIHAFASLAAVSIETARAYQRFQEQNLQTITALAAAVEARDPYTSGHSQKVTEYTTAIAAKMGLSTKEIENLRMAGLLHDIGKIGIPDSVLNKPARLTAAERIMIDSHPVTSAEIVGKIEALAHLMPTIRHHHERWDGKGYPDGLKGDEIPLLARILAVGDGFEAMTAERPYRFAKSQEKAIEELKAGAATQWDPKVVEVFLKVLEEEQKQDT